MQIDNVCSLTEPVRVSDSLSRTFCGLERELPVKFQMSPRHPRVDPNGRVARLGPRVGLLASGEHQTIWYALTVPLPNMPATNGGGVFAAKRAMRCLPFASSSAMSDPVAFFIRITMTRAECLRIASS